MPAVANQPQATPEGPPARPAKPDEQRLRLARPLSAVWHALQDAVLPQTCVACGEWIATGAGPACSTCADELTRIEQANYCPHCGRTMPPSAIDSLGCARCKHENFWNVAGVARVGAYETPIQRLVTGLKYAGRERNAEFLGGLVAAAIERRGWRAELDWLVPVPMHWFRRMQRPCDHAALLATAVGRRLNVPVLRGAMRVKHTLSQVAMQSRAQRFENVEGCFDARPRAKAQLVGKCVCIVDNLLMTGATVHEVSKVLRRAGARRIYAAVIARTVTAGDAQAEAPPPLAQTCALQTGTTPVT